MEMMEMFNMYTRRSGSQHEPHNESASYREIIDELMRHYELNKIYEAINT